MPPQWPSRDLAGRDHHISQPLTIQISGHVDHDAVWENNPQSGAAGVECLGGRCCTVFPIVAPYLNGKKRQSCTPQSA
jgi:hypothetical protein